MEKKNESIYEQIEKDRETFLANERVIGGLQVVYTMFDELSAYKCSSIVDEVLCNLCSQIDTADTLLSKFNADFKRQIDEKDLKARMDASNYLKVGFKEEDLGEIFK